MRNDDTNRVEDPNDSLRDEEFAQLRADHYSDYINSIEEIEE